MGRRLSSGELRVSVDALLVHSQKNRSPAGVRLELNAEEAGLNMG